MSSGKLKTVGKGLALMLLGFLIGQLASRTNYKSSATKNDVGPVVGSDNGVPSQKLSLDASIRDADEIQLLQICDELNKISRQSVRRDYTLKILKRWLRVNPSGAFEYMFLLPESERNGKMVSEIAVECGVLHGKVGVELIKLLNRSDQEQRQLFNASIKGWSSVDVNSAAEYVTASGTGREMETGISIVAAQFAASSMETNALKWLRSLDQHGQQFGMFSYINALKKKDPVRAFEIASAIPDSRTRATLAGSSMAALASSLPQKAFDISNSIKDPALAYTGRSAVINEIAKNDLSAATYYLKQIQSREERVAIASQVANGYVEKDCVKIAGWLLHWPDGEISPDAVANVASAYLQKDTIAALTWMGSITDPKVKDKALEVAAGRMSTEDPAIAKNLTALISNLEARERTKLYVAAASRNKNFIPAQTSK